MKNLKQLTTIIVIAFLMLTNFNAIAQQKNKASLTGFSVEIPQDLKMTAAEKANYTIIKASKYDPELGGTVYANGFINSDGKVKLESIIVPDQNVSRIQSGCTGGNYRACAIGCTDKPSEMGVILCTAYCVISCINQ